MHGKEGYDADLVFDYGRMLTTKQDVADYQLAGIVSSQC